jgi:hypothetical protein
VEYLEIQKLKSIIKPYEKDRHNESPRSVSRHYRGLAKSQSHN